MEDERNMDSEGEGRAWLGVELNAARCAAWTIGYRECWRAARARRVVGRVVVARSVAMAGPRVEAILTTALEVRNVRLRASRRGAGCMARCEE